MSAKSFKKKKDREKEVKKKLLARRTALRAETKKEREKEKEVRELQKVTNKIEGRTIRNKKDDEAIVSQLHHNLEILEALQREQDLLEERQKEAPMVNMEGVPLIEEETPPTPTPTPPSTGGKLGASADVVFIPNTESNEETKEQDAV